MRRNNKICVGPPLSRNNVFYINDIEINALNINNCNIVYDSILSSQYPLFFKNLLRKNWWNLLLFFRSERKKGETVRKTSFDERNWFEPNLFPSRKKELSKYVWLLHSYISAMFFNYERNIHCRYIYLNTWNIFLSSCPSISRLKWKREQLKRTIEEYLTFDLFSFPFPESASFAAIANVLLVRFDTPLTCETPIFLELSTYFLYI